MTFASCLCIVMSVLGCSEPPPVPVHGVTFIATADDEPLAGVQVRLGDRVLGATNEEGELGVTLRGKDGNSIVYAVTCPVGHRTPTDLTPLILRSFKPLPGVKNRGIEIKLNCPPSERHASIIVRATGGANLPVMMLGREVGRTDANGIAHVLFTASPNTTFRITVDTSSNEFLRPTSPTQEFLLGDADDIFLFDQTFVEQKPEVIHHRTGPKHGPSKLPTRIM